MSWVSALVLTLVYAWPNHPTGKSEASLRNIQVRVWYTCA